MGNGIREHSAGGAAAAAADLARARQSLGVAERDDDALRTARDVFRDIDVLLRALRTYEADHPRIEELYDQLQMSFGACLVYSERLAVALQPRTVLLDAEVVYEADRIEANPWFPLFGDGVRGVEFRRGMPRDEIVELMTLLRRLLDKPDAEAEYDAVTLLWERELPHVRLHAIDGFADGGADAGARQDALFELLAANRDRELPPTAAPPRRGPPSLDFLRSENLSIVDAVPRDARSVSYRLMQVTDDDVVQFAALCELDKTYAGRYFGALLSALAHRGDTADGPRILECLRELCLRLIAVGELRKAHQMLVHLGRAVPGGASIADYLIPDQAVARIIAILEAHPDTHIEDDAFALVRALSPGRARALLEAIGCIDDRRLRARLYEIAAGWGASAAQAAGELLRDSMGETAKELLDLLRAIGGDAAHLALEQASFDTTTATRAEALRAFFQLAPQPAAAKRAERGLRATDSGTRRIALEFLLEQREPRAANWIKRRMRDPIFASVSMDERRRVYRAYALLGGNKAGEWLLEQLAQRNTLGRARIDEERQLAAYALGHLRYQPAKPLLQQLASARMTRRELKQECADALAIIDHPRDEAAVQPAGPVVEPATAATGKFQAVRERRPTDFPTYRGKPVNPKALSSMTSYLVTAGKNREDDAEEPPNRDEVDELLSRYVEESDD